MSTGGQTGTVLSVSSHATLVDSDIRTRVRQITKRDNTDDLTNTEIDEYTLEACREISKRTLCLKESITGTLAADGNTITAPTDMIPSHAAIDALYLDSTLLDPITFDEWRVGKLSGYAYRNDTIYINPAANTSCSYTLYYSKYHPSSVDFISLNDDFKMAIVFFVCKKIYDDYEQPDKALENEQKYENELIKHDIPEELPVVTIRQFRD